MQKDADPYEDLVYGRFVSFLESLDAALRRDTYAIQICQRNYFLSIAKDSAQSGLPYQEYETVFLQGVLLVDIKTLSDWHKRSEDLYDKWELMWSPRGYPIAVDVTVSDEDSEYVPLEDEPALKELHERDEWCKRQNVLPSYYDESGRSVYGEPYGDALRNLYIFITKRFQESGLMERLFGTDIPVVFVDADALVNTKWLLAANTESSLAEMLEYFPMDGRPRPE